MLDKDNTLTHPYSTQIAPQLVPSLDRCQKAFAGRLVLFSNSAGLHQFDPEGNTLLPNPEVGSVLCVLNRLGNLQRLT